MNVKQLLTNTLLVATLLIGGGNFAWADTTVTYDFSAMGQAGYSLSWGGTIYEVNGLNCYNLNGFKDAESNEVLSFSDYYLLRSREKNNEYVYLNGANGLRGGSKAAPLQIFNLQAGDKVVFTYTCDTGGDLYWHTTNATSGGVAVTANATLTSGAEYVVTGDGEQNIIVYFPAGKNTCLKRLAITTTKLFGQVKTYDFTSWAKSNYSFTTSESSVDVKFTPVGLSSSATHNCKFITAVMNGENVVQNINSELAAYGDVSHKDNNNNYDNNIRFRTDRYQGLYNYGSGPRAFVISNMKAGGTVTMTTALGTIYTISENLTTDGENAIAGGTAITSGSTYSVLSNGNVNVQIASSSSLSKLVTETPESLTGTPTITYSDGYVTITPSTSSFGSYVYTYYTTDGTEPAPGNGKLYTAPIASVGSVNIKAKSYLITGAVSETASYSATILTSPTITRSNNSVTIAADAGTIYYKYNSDNYSEYTGTITVTADAPIYAYAAADGSENSAIVSREVALFPTTGITRVENATPITSGTHTSTRSSETTTGSKGTYSALLIDDAQWGNNVYLSASNWGIRFNGGWYVNSGTVYFMMKNMKAGDIIVLKCSYLTSPEHVNATYSEKYSYNGNYAYIVDADGDVEIGLSKSGSMQYFSGVDAYTHNVTGTQVGDFYNTTGYMAATSEKVTLKPGESYHYNFKNYNSGGNGNFNNYLLAAYDGSDVVKAVVRADNFEVVDWKNTGCTNDFNWTNFVSKMNGATVDMTVSYSASNVLNMTATITTNEATPATWNYSYTSDYTGSGISLSDNIKIALSVDHAWLDIVSEGKASVGATIGATGWSTFASSYALDLSSMTASTGEVKAYYASAVGDNSVTMTTTDAAIQAGEGIMLKGTPAATITIPVAASGEAISGNMLVGVTTNTTISKETENYANFYVLSNNGGTAEFQNLKNWLETKKSGSDTEYNTVTINAGKAYLDATGTTGARLSIAFDDETTGVQELKNSKIDGLQTGDCYNLRGQRVSQPTKGLYIVNGKKVIMK